MTARLQAKNIVKSKGCQLKDIVLTEEKAVIVSELKSDSQRTLGVFY